jgi:hypothetical protein
MKLNKGKDIFDKATVQCMRCGRYFVKKMPHLCNKQYRKHNQKWFDLLTKN